MIYNAHTGWREQPDIKLIKEEEDDDRVSEGLLVLGDKQYHTDSMIRQLQIRDIPTLKNLFLNLNKLPAEQLEILQKLINQYRYIW